MVNAIEKDAKLKQAIEVMKTYLDAGPMKERTVRALIADGFIAEDAERYAQLAYDWWVDAYCE